MQTTYYSVMREESKGMWVELTPRPRNRRRALELGIAAAHEGKQVKVERHVMKREVIKTHHRRLTTD